MDDVASLEIITGNLISSHNVQDYLVRFYRLPPIGSVPVRYKSISINALDNSVIYELVSKDFFKCEDKTLSLLNLLCNGICDDL